jgi:hypothetical protein
MRGCVRQVLEMMGGRASSWKRRVGREEEGLSCKGDGEMSPLAELGNEVRYCVAEELGVSIR